MLTHTSARATTVINVQRHSQAKNDDTLKIGILWNEFI